MVAMAHRTKKEPPEHFGHTDGRLPVRQPFWTLRLSLRMTARSPGGPVPLETLGFGPEGLYTIVYMHEATSMDPNSPLIQ